MMQKLLDGVEKVGNKVPHPVLMFFYLMIGVIVLSALLALLGVSVTEQIAVPVPIEVTPDFYEDVSEYTLSGIGDEDVDFVIQEQTIAINSLLSIDGIRFLFTSFVPNFQGFGALAVTLIAMMGAGAADIGGLLAALIRKLVKVAPKPLIGYSDRLHRRALQPGFGRRLSDPDSAGGERPFWLWGGTPSLAWQPALAASLRSSWPTSSRRPPTPC
jgi:aminobenzoyl-glutamate transport protein